MSTKTRFEKEAKGNSEMAYSSCLGSDRYQYEIEANCQSVQDGGESVK